MINKGPGEIFAIPLKGQLFPLKRGSLMKIISIITWLIFFSIWSVDLNAETKAINVICDEWAPYQIVEKNRVSGFSTRIVQAVFSKMEIDIREIKAYPWKRAITMIKNGSADALFSTNYTEARTEFAYYPEEMIVQSPWVMWAREGSGLKYDSLDDLKGKSVGLVRGYSYTPEFWDFVKKHAVYEEVSNDALNFRKLNAERVDYVIAEMGNGLYLIGNLGLDRIKPFKNTPVKTDGLYIIFNKKNVPRSLVDKFSNELKKLKQESLYANLLDQYFNYRAP